MSCYLITGGAGFIGSHLTRDLVRAGERVVVYDWFPQRSALERLLSDEEIESSVKIVQGDVTDYSHLIRTLRQHEVERVVHLAAVMIHEFNANPLLGVRVNCDGTTAVFEAARFLGLEKVVWASSGSVFGPGTMYDQEYIPNDAPHYPQNLYGAAKSFDEVVSAYYVDKYGIDITALRFVMVYGAGQTRGRTAAVIRQLIYHPALGKPGRVPAAADNVLGFTYVDDTVRAIVLASRASRPKQKAYSVMGAIHTIQEIADCVHGFFPEAEINLMPLEKSASHTIMTCKYDMRPIEEDLGYRPQWTMPQGVKETVNNVRRENGLEPVA
jgi:nucleoside-diphosphate-sugar epimerase